MKRLTKDQRKAMGEIVTRLRVAEDALNAAISTFNAGLETLFAPVETAVDLLNEVRVDAAEFRDEIVSAMEDYAGERSDNWQESDAAATFSEWMGEWEGFTSDEVSIDSPGDIEDPDYVADALESLPLESA